MLYCWAQLPVGNGLAAARPFPTEMLGGNFVLALQTRLGRHMQMPTPSPIGERDHGVEEDVDTRRRFLDGRELVGMVGDALLAWREDHRRGEDPGHEVGIVTGLACDIAM